MDIQFLKEFLKNNTAVLISCLANRRYLTGFPSSYGFVLVTKNGISLFVDGRYYTAAKNTIAKDINLVCIKDLYLQISEILAINEIKTVFVESEISVGLYDQLVDKLPAEIIASKQLDDTLYITRSVKTNNEIKCVKIAQEIAEKAFENILNFIKPGVRELDIALELDYYMRKLGSEGVSFETIAVSGKNSALPHGVPNQRAIDNGDFVTMDFGAVYGGYHSDMTRTVAVGFVTDEMEEVYQTVLEAQKSAIASIKSGASCKEVDATARSIIEKKGYGSYFNHSTGHGVGLEIHEFPNLSQKSESKLLENQIVTCEPGIYIPEKFGVRIEDMIVVKNNSHQNLTKAAKQLIIL